MEGKKKAFIGKRLMVLAMMFLVMGIYFVSSDIVETFEKEKVSATISDVVRNEYRSEPKRGHYVYVDYTFEGKEYKHVYIGSFSYPSLSVGSKGEECFVYVDRNNPENIGFANFYSIVFFPIAIAFGVIGYRLMDSSRKEE